jgi:hypothetical protein
MAMSTGRMFGAHGLILSADRSRTGLGEQDYIRAARRGELVRIRRGAFCESGHWATLAPRERHVLRMRAVAAASSRQLVFRGYSAGALWGMPVLDDWPEDAEVCSDPATGGRSDPGVRRRPLAPAQVHERDGLLVTSVASAALDVALVSGFAPAVATLDWARWRKNAFRVTADEVARELEARGLRYGLRHAEAALDFSTHLSDSFGESMTRAVFHELGYPLPELQVRFSDRHGDMFPDYFWRKERKVGEFDGAAKYLRPGYSAGLTPGEIVWREKKREDRLRKQCDGVIRIIWSETRNPRLLDDQLREFGLRPVRSPR